MADRNPDVLVNPTSLQASIQSVADSLKVWTATLPFPGWLWTPNSPSRTPVSYPTIDLFAYIDPKYKGQKIYLDPKLYPPSSDKGFTDLKKDLGSTNLTHGHHITYHGGWMAKTARTGTEVALSIARPTDSPPPLPPVRQKIILKIRALPKYRFGCNQSKVFKPETWAHKLSRNDLPDVARKYTATNNRHNNRTGGKEMTPKTGTMLVKTAGHNPCGCKFSIAEDAGIYFAVAWEVHSTSIMCQLKMELLACPHDSLIPLKYQSYCQWPKPMSVTVCPTIFAVREIK
jgi:hypothetical protein